MFGVWCMIYYSPFGWYSDRSPVTFISAQPCDGCLNMLQAPQDTVSQFKTNHSHPCHRETKQVCGCVCLCVCELQQEEPSMNRTCSKFQKSLLSLIVLTKFNNNKNIYDFLLTSTVVWSAETSPRLFEKIIVVLTILSYCKQRCKETVLQENNMVTNVQICENQPPSLNAVGAFKMIQETSWSFDLLYIAGGRFVWKCGGGNSVQYEMTWALFRDIFVVCSVTCLVKSHYLS